MTPLRIMHWPTVVGGHPTGLSRAERVLGAESWVEAIEASPYGYAADRVVPTRLGRPGRLVGRAAALARALHRADVVHFNFGQTFMPPRLAMPLDLPLLAGAGKRLLMTFQGCDARRRSFCATRGGVTCCGDAAGDVPGLCSSRDDAAKRRLVEAALRRCERVFVLNPDLLRLAPGAEFMPYASVDPAAVRPPAGEREPGPVRVLHAPTNRAIKGTSAVLAAFERLRSRGVAFEPMLVESRPHDEAMAIYARADILVDQLRVGWYGGLAVELMAMARPVVCAIRDDDAALVPAPMAAELPIVRADAASLDTVLERLICDAAARHAVGQASRRFVERWHDPAAIAGALLAMLGRPGSHFWDMYRPRDAEASHAGFTPASACGPRAAAVQSAPSNPWAGVT